jgi:2-methylcitrate dehydratase PrpD
LPAPAQIRDIQVSSYNLAAELNNPAPHNTLAAKFSVPFAVATRLVHGHSGLASFSWDAVRNPAVLALAQRVSVTEDPAMTRRLPYERPARVVITLTDGSTLVGEAGVNRGDAAAPYSRAELATKFMDLTSRVWPAAHAQRVLDATLALGKGDASLVQWCQLLRVPALGDVAVP